MSPGVLLVITPRMQKLSANPGCDFARVRVLARLATADACENNSSGGSPPCQRPWRTLSQLAGARGGVKTQVWLGDLSFPAHKFCIGCRPHRFDDCAVVETWKLLQSLEQLLAAVG